MEKLIRYYTPLFICLLVIDIYTKIYLPSMPYRYYSKVLVMGSLLVFTAYAIYKKKVYVEKYIFYGLILFFIGDILIIDHLNKIKFIISIGLFVIGKILYIVKFSHKEDFSNKRLVPFFVICFLLVAILYSLIFTNLKDYFLPITLYFFISLVMTLFAYIRKGVVNNKSYYTVLLGVGLFVLSEATMVIKMFYGDVMFQDFLVMFGYAMGQYLIILGLILNRKAHDNKSVLV
ncbi:lysoplasmalogenase [Olleya sp. YSTF-M6]|uniref:Lysoplasmalogenase n=1 Tax=Olleya sediminilitoris TaxID=2795739 RepID=A0ABS1WJS9_9FLAO|nr:lysoplasmalogenase [Olleya sediminilitoris]MBL7559368.1 lysoplasmalogenase [Olleya sediminilitoris]